MKNNSLRFLIKWIVLPALLILFYIIASLLLYPVTGFSTLQYKEDPIILLGIKGKLLKNNSISGDFIAKDNNLGIISIKFKQPKVMSFEDEDILSFTIKEQHDNKVVYVGQYRSGGIFGTPFYPFGFPKIKDSKNKRYHFSLKSFQGSSENALEISSEEPIIYTEYVFSKQELMLNRKKLASFIIAKIFNSFSDLDFIKYSLIYILPFVFYVLIIFSKKFFINYLFIAAIIPALIFASIIFGVNQIPGIFFSLIGLWIMASYFAKLESSISYFFSIIFSLLSVIALLQNNQKNAANYSNWLYIFIFIGTLQLLIEIKSKKNYIKYNKFLKMIIPKQIYFTIKAISKNEKN